VGVETNGTNPEMVAYLIKNKLVDYLAMDIKAPLEKERYGQLTGVAADLEKIKESIRIIIDSKIDHEFRTTVVPGLLDKKDILGIIRSIRGARKYYLQKFQPGETVGDVSVKNDYGRDWFKAVLKDLRENTSINIELRI